MNRLISIFLTALVVVHTTFGCCIHHAHSCESECCDSPTPSAADCPCSGHEHGEPNIPDAPTVSYDSSHGHDSHRCEDDPCLFFSTMSHSEFGESFGKTYVTVCHAVTTEPQVAVAVQRSTPIVPVTRVHLALSVLLI